MTFSEDRLRQALEARAEAVRTSPDALVTIRARVRRDSRRHRGLVAGISALATGAVGATTAVVLSLGSGVPVVPPVPSSSAPTSGAPTTPAPTTTAPTTPNVGVVSQPIYLVATVNGRDMLYREYHLVPGGSLQSIVASALTDMIEGAPADPSYRTLWPAGVTVRGVQLAGDTVSVDLSLPAAVPANPSVAVQQLVYTVTAVTAQAQRAEVDQVRIMVDGVPVADLWGVDTSAALRRASSVNVVAPVWLIEPHQGAVVGQTFTVTMQGTVFEAAAVLRVRAADGSLLQERPVQLDAGPPARGNAQFTLTLAPGTYTLQAFYFSAADGSIQAVDDHTITVR